MIVLTVLVEHYVLLAINLTNEVKIFFTVLYSLITTIALKRNDRNFTRQSKGVLSFSIACNNTSSYGIWAFKLTMSCSLVWVRRVNTPMTVLLPAFCKFELVQQSLVFYVHWVLGASSIATAGADIRFYGKFEVLTCTGSLLDVILFTAYNTI